ncbi:MAG: CNNM domain-containing protein, partial [Cytophagales bacterium]
MPEAVYFVLLFILLSAFFSGIEIAFISSNKLQFELLHKQGKSSGKRLIRFFQNPTNFITTTMIGNTLCLVLYDFYMTELIDPFFKDLNNQYLDNDIVFVIVHSLIATFIALIFAEFLPKSIFFSHPNALLSIFSFPISLIFKLLWPLTQLVIVPTKLFMKKVAKIDFSDEKPVFGYTDLDNFIRQHTVTPKDDKKDNSEIDTKILENALEFKHLKVYECMRPRTEIVALDYEEGMEGLLKLFNESGHSKIVIYKEKIDDIVGYVHIMSLFSKPSNIDDILTPILTVPEVSSAS